MRIAWITIFIAAGAQAALGAGFVDRELPLKEALSLFPGEEDPWGAPGVDEGEEEGWGPPPTKPGEKEEFPIPEEGESRRKPAPAPQKPFNYTLQGFLGGVLPFAAKEASYSGGFMLGVGAQFPLEGVPFPQWIRPNLHLGFTSAGEEGWDGNSTLILLQCDGGYTVPNTGKMRLSGFICLGVAVEIFSGTESTVTGEASVSEVNTNFLAGFGGSAGFAATENLDFHLDIRLTFPLGSQNVQGLFLGGVGLTYRF
ncbi:MAG: hypothetical protein ACYTHN_10220 [Planctomycetota bacterium]|jgi:hypothetical protein